MKARWNELEASEKVHPEFARYFEKNKDEDIFDHMRVELSKDGVNQSNRVNKCCDQVLE